MKLAILFSLFLSIIHSILFYGQEIGISVFLYVVVALFFLLTILEKQGKIKNRKALLLSIPIILLSATYFLFNNIVFKILNIPVILLLFLIMIIGAVSEQIRTSRLIQNICSLLFGCMEEIGNAAREISKNFSVEKKENMENGKKAKNIVFRQILIGVLVSLPILIVVLILLSTADEMFAAIFKDIFISIRDLININTLYKLWGRTIFIVLLTLYFISFIIRINKGIDNSEQKAKIKIDGITVSTLLTMLNIVYVIFAAVQVIHIITDMKANTSQDYAGYARTGFFQLMAVSIINFIIILITKNNKKEVSKATKTYTIVMNLLLAMFTIIILITSILRMRLYQAEYGYTFLRLMVYFVQITELLLIVPTLVYIVKEKFNVFKWYLPIIIIMYLTVNFMNIDSFIAKGNIDKYILEKGTKREIDFYYLKRTSTDAVPEIIRLLEVDNKELRTEVNNYLFNEYENLKDKKMTFQNFNISELRAKKELEKLNLKYESDFKIKITNSL